MCDWQPIETAPKDGQLVDLWCVCPYGEGDIEIRLPNCSWHENDKIFPWDGWVRVLDDGDWDAVEAPPCSEFGLPHWKPTHWMPLPTPPKEGTE